MRLSEFATIKPLTPEQARIEALKNQKSRAGDALQAERDRQKRKKAADQLNAAQQAFRAKTECFALRT